MLPRRIVCALAAACFAPVGCVPWSSPGKESAPDARASKARTQLIKLDVRPWHSMRGYSRDKFRHWNEQGNGCDTREVVLKRAGSGVRAEDGSCRIKAGQWVSSYDGAVLTSATRLDIDHVVPLANAWRSGADQWTNPTRKRFANDLREPQLVAVSATSNRSKGDQGPEAWKPPNVRYWCQYARDWITVKYVYRLSVTQDERAALEAMLGHC